MQAVVTAPSDQKMLVQRQLEIIWQQGLLDLLSEFWTADCINHAAPPEANVGLSALRQYHEAFMAAFSAFADVSTAILQQIEEADRVVTHMRTEATHAAEFMGVLATGRRVTLNAIRIDRFDSGKIAEHWSVGDMSGLLQQIQQGSFESGTRAGESTA